MHIFKAYVHIVKSKLFPLLIKYGINTNPITTIGSIPPSTRPVNLSLILRTNKIEVMAVLTATSKPMATERL